MIRPNRRPNRHQGSGNIGRSGNTRPRGRGGLVGKAGPSVGGLGAGLVKPLTKPPPVVEFSPVAQAMYNATVGNAKTENSNLHAENLWQTQSLSNEYGIDDVSNPFSKMKMLQQSYERDKSNQGTTFASQGQFFSGAYNSNKEFLRQGNLADQDALKREYSRAKHAYAYSNIRGDAAETAAGQSANAQRLFDNLGTS